MSYLVTQKAFNTSAKSCSFPPAGSKRRLYYRRVEHPANFLDPLTPVYLLPLPLHPIILQEGRILPRGRL